MEKFNLHTKRIGYERDAWFLTVFQQEQLFNVLPQATFVDCSGFIEELQVIKSEWELEKMKEASRFAEIAIQAGIEVTETGIEVIPRLLGVLHVTVGATVAGFLLALILGLMLAFGRRSKNRSVSGLTGGVVEFVRLTPLLVQLYFIYFVMPEIGLTLSAFTAGVLGLGIHYAAYISEVYRAVGLSREEAEERAKSMLEKVGMLDKIDQYPANLSGGQQQRVAIARALVMRPKVMLFDEPTSALDPETVGEVLGVIKEIAKEGEMAMMLITHEMSFAREVAGRVVFFDEGRIVEQGPPEKIFENPESDRLRDFLRRFNMLFNGKNGASV